MARQPRRSFSAIVPHYNDAKRLACSLAALGAQTVAFDEIIVVDDASSDGSLPLVEAMVAGVPNARLVRNAKNLGVVGAINVGIREAAGRFIFLASSNDTYSPQMVEWAEEALERHPEAVFLCGNCVMEWDTGERSAVEVSLPQRRAYFSPREVAASARQRILGFAGGATFIERSTLRWAGDLQPALRWSSDWFVYSLLALTHGCCVIPEQLSTLESARGSYSRGALRWDEHRAVVLAFLELLRDRFPAQLPLFRDAAVLPTYSARELLLIVRRRDLWPYLTPLLADRCLAELRRKLHPRRLVRLARRLMSIPTWSAAP